MKLIKSGGTKEKRKIILASGGSAEINAAIVKLNAAGGGTLVLDGLLDLDGDITMLSDVLVKGNGPGTGMRNNTANDYAINFVGSTPTWYEAGAPADGSITCDTVAEAANFSQGDVFLIRDYTGNNTIIGHAFASADGNPSTGVITTFTNPDFPYADTDTQLGILSGMKNAGLAFLDLINASSGTLKVNVQYAFRSKIESCNFYETNIDIEHAVETDVIGNTFNLEDNTTPFSYWIQLVNGVSAAKIQGNALYGATYGIYTTTTCQAASLIDISRNFITSKNGIYLNRSVANLRPVFFNFLIDSNRLAWCQDGNGSTAGTGIYHNGQMTNSEICNNVIGNEYGKAIDFDEYSGCGRLYVTFSGNTCYSSCDINSLQYCTFTGNVIAGVLRFDSGLYYCTVTGNKVTSHFYATDKDNSAVSESIISNNHIVGFLYLDGDATYKIENCVVSNNVVNYYIRAATHVTNCVFDGNNVTGDAIFTAGAGELAEKITFTNNIVGGNFTMGEADQDNWVFANNRIDGTITYPTGENNKIEQAGGYSEQDNIIRIGGGTSTEINAAIMKLNGMGGGTVVLDTLIDMDADIDLLANVFLKGNGPNTGLRNNTANDYKVKFEDSAPTAYGVTSVSGAGVVTMDTAADAANFTLGNKALLLDEDFIPYACWLSDVKVAGDGGAGTFTVAGEFDLSGTSFHNTTTAQVISKQNSGILDMELINSSTGSLKVSLAYVAEFKLSNVAFNEASILSDHAGFITIDACTFTAEDDLSFTDFINVNDYTYLMNVNGCIFNRASSVLNWTGSGALNKCSFVGCTFHACGKHFDLTPTGITNTNHCDSLVISGCNADKLTSGYGFEASNVYFSKMVISSNKLASSSSWFRTDTAVTIGFSVIDGNIFYSQSDNYINSTVRYTTFSNNEMANLYLTYRTSNCVISGNRFSGGPVLMANASSEYFIESTIVGNTIASTLTLTGLTAVKNISDNVFSSNKMMTLNATQHLEDCVFTGNRITGNATIGTASETCQRIVFNDNSVGGNVIFGNPNANDCVVTNNDIEGTLTFLTGSNNRVEQAGKYSILGNVMHLAYGGSTEINASINILDALGGGTLFIDALLDLDGDITLKSNVEIIGQGQATGFRNNTANDYDIDFVGNTPTFYDIGSPGNGSITTDTAAEAGNFSQGDLIFMKDTSGGIAVCGSTQASADGDTDTGEILCFINPDVYQFGTGGSAAPITGLDNARLKNLTLQNASTGTLEINMQYATRCGVEQCTLLEAQVKIDTCIDTAIEGCKFELEDNVTPLPQWVTLVDQISRLDITECFFMGGYYGVYAPAATAVFVDQLTVRHSTFTTLYAIYLDHAASPANIWFSGVDINNNSFFGSQDGAGNTSGTAIFIEAGLFNFNIADNIIGAEYATGIDLDDFAGATRQYGSIVGNTCFIGCNFEAIKQTTVTGNCFLGVCVFDYGPQNCNISANTMAGFYMRDSNRAGVYENVVTGNVINSVAYIQGDATYPCERLIFSDNFVDGAIYLESHFNDCVFKGNIFDGNVEFTTATANSLDGMMFTENTVLGNFVVTTETDHDDWVISLNRITGTITQLTGSNNRVLPFNQERYDDLKIGPGSFVLAGSANPSLEDWQPGGTGPTFKVYKFRVNDEVFAWKQIPHDWKEGSDLKPHIHWTPADRGNEESGNLVGWKIDYTITDVSGVFPTGQTLDFSDACSGVDDTHEVTASLTISGASLNASCMLAIRIYRSDTGTDDTWAGTTAAQSPGLLEVDIHYQKDDIGSDAEFVKD